MNATSPRAARAHSSAPLEAGGAGVGLGLAAAAILSLTGVLIALISRAYALPALTIAFWRDVFAALALAAGAAFASIRRSAVSKAVQAAGPTPSLAASRGFARTAWPVLLAGGLTLAAFNVV